MKTTKTEAAIEAILNYFEENPDAFADCMEDMDSWNGYLGDDRYYGMDEFDELNDNRSPLELISSINFSNFNPNDNYFRFDIYGIESDDERDYSDYLSPSTVRDMLDIRSHLWAIDNDADLCELFDALETAIADDEADDPAA